MSRLKMENIVKTKVSYVDYTLAAADVIAATEAANDAEEHLELLTDLVSCESRLSEYATLCTDSLESDAGGLDVSAAKVLDMAIESLTDLVWVESYGVASVESFDSPATRAEATTGIVASIEGIKDKMKQGIINVSKKVWRKIKTFLVKIMTGTKRLHSAINSVGNVLDKVAKPSTSTTIDDKNHAVLYSGNKLLIDDTIRTFDVIAAKLKTRVVGTTSVLEGTHSLLGGDYTFAYTDGALNISTKKRSADDSFSDDARGTLGALHAGAKKLADTIDSAKALNSLADKLEKDGNERMSKLQDTDGDDDAAALKAVRVHQATLIKMMTFATLTLLMAMYKSAWVIVKIIKDAIKEHYKSVKKSSDSN